MSATWYKEGVYGKLNYIAAQGLRRVKKLFASKNEDIYITSVQEGTHSPGSLHPLGDAWDQRKNRNVSIAEIKAYAGQDFDVVEERDHVHIEYDPK